MAPRLQCLRLAQDAAKAAPSFRAAFSTTVRAMADPPPSSSSLLDLGNTPQPTPRSSLQLPNTSSNFRSTRRREELRKIGAEGMLRQAVAKNRNGEQLAGTEEVYRKGLASDLTRQLKRKWEHGDIYAPHDLSPEELRKWRGKTKNTYDVFDVLDMNPIDEYKNFSIMSEYMTPMGRIKGSNQTGLRPVNQRKIAKAIRRSIGLGIMPSVHRHPELLMKSLKGREEADRRKSLQATTSF